MVGHPFVREMVEGSLPTEKFRRYFLQDYLFVRDLSVFLSLAISKAPDFDAARKLSAFLNVLVTGEEELFQRSFREMGVSGKELENIEYLPACRAFADYLVRLGHEGDFHEILTALFCTEGTYLDWAQRAVEDGKSPGVAAYREWIEIHADQGLADFVAWVRNTLDAADLEGRRKRLEEVFRTCLRHEVLFWDMAYEEEQWPR
jgi:thiaminase/transcriptional activator TenA